MLWLCGPPAVGKSTVGFEIFLRVLGAGVPAAYVDLAQIGFCRPAPDDDPDHHLLKTHQLARVWEGFRAAGARCLVMSGNVTDQETVDRYTDAIPSAAWTVCRLRAGPDTLAQRIMLRAEAVDQRSWATRCAGERRLSCASGPLRPPGSPTPSITPASEISV